MSLILVIDSDPLIRELLPAALRSAGHQAASASTRQEAMMALQQQRPDLILLEPVAPLADGLALLKSLRSTESAHPPVVLLTSADKPQILAAAKLGIHGFMHKSSFSWPKLVQMINKVLGHGDSTPSVVLTPGPHSCGEQRDASSKTATEPSTSAAIAPASSIVHSSQIQDLRELKPIISRADLLSKLDDCGELKGFSPAVAEVINLTSSARCSIEQIAKAISRDHGMALKILKLANSAVYTRGEPVESVHKAVLRIGVSQIRQAVLNLAVIDQYRGLNSNLLDGNQFWEHAIATGIVAAEIARSRNEKEADSAFTMGLLHDVGRLVLVNQLSDSYAKVLETASQWQLPLEQLEHRMLSFNHAEAMDKVLRKWNFPKELINPLVFHHLSGATIRQSAPQDAIATATLGLANRLTHALMLGSSGNQTIYPTEELCELLRLDPAVILRIEQTAREETDKMKFALLAHSNQPNWMPLRDTHRQRLSFPLRPLYVTSDPAIDAYRIFVNQLADTEQQGPPNIGIIHFRHPRDRIRLSEEFKAKEQTVGMEGLPLIAISPTGNLTPEQGMLAGRTVRCLTSPTTVTRFLDALISAYDNSAMAAAA